MEVKEEKYGDERMFTFKGIGNNYTYIGLTLATDASNCKLSYIHQSGCLAYMKDDTRKKVIDHMLGRAKGCVILNTTSKPVYEFLKKTYPVYYAHEVPIGYGNGFQFHIAIKNTVVENRNCRNPKAIDKKDSLTKKKIKDKLVKILKNKRRKADYVDEFIKSL